MTKEQADQIEDDANAKPAVSYAEKAELSGEKACVQRVDIPLACQQCGQITEELEEGYCAECHHERQSKLDQHNAAFDRWACMTPEQRDSEIKLASR